MYVMYDKTITYLICYGLFQTQASITDEMYIAEMFGNSTQQYTRASSNELSAAD